MKTAISAENISKAFNDQSILDNLNLEVGNNDLYGLIGLNGIGKTTLIKILLGISAPDSGVVKIFNETNAQNHRLRKKLCYLPEKFNPSSELKGSELINLLSRFHRSRVSDAEIAKMCDKFHFEVEDLKRRIKLYSKGMVQKVGLISTFITNAKLYILDEPMSGLDFKTRNALKEEIRRVRKEGATVFFTSHVLSDIEDLCSRVGILHEGRLVFQDTLAKLTAQEGNIEKAVLKTIDNTG